MNAIRNPRPVVARRGLRVGSAKPTKEESNMKTIIDQIIIKGFWSALPAVLVGLMMAVAVVSLLHACDHQAKLNQEAAQRHLAGSR